MGAKEALSYLTMTCYLINCSPVSILRRKTLLNDPSANLIISTDTQALLRRSDQGHVHDDARLEFRQCDAEGHVTPPPLHINQCRIQIQLI